jgi:signal transduction histidine kinase
VDNLRSVQIHPVLQERKPPQFPADSSYAGLELCPYPAVKLNLSWTIKYANPAAMKTFFNGEDPVGENYWSLFSDRVGADSNWKNRHLLALEECRPSSEFVVFFTSPVNLWMAITIRSASDGFFLFFRDITFERFCAEALQKNERLASLGRLSSTIAHEILNPLEAVINLLYLADQTNDLTPVKEYIRAAEHEISRASSIVNQTLRFNRNTDQTSVVSCDVMLREILLLQKARLSGVAIKTNTNDVEAVQICCNEGEVRQILINLITNSVDAMSPGGGKLVIRARKSARRDGEGVVITVADSGTGMSRDTLKKSFDPFFTTKKDRGNGLGLWISRELAAKHGGTLRARSSQCPGKSGSVFQLFLPVAA